MGFDRVKYTRDYRQNNLKQVTVNLSKSTDSSIIEWLESQKNKSSYIKELIRKDMNKGVRA